MNHAQHQAMTNGADMRQIVLDFYAGQGVPLTHEQQDVVFAAHQRMLVIAGAGAGKTTTMSQRIAWAVVTGMVAPERILGLTFTRKAAGELATEALNQVAALREVIDSRSGSKKEHLVQPHRHFQLPTVSTYNSFASEIAMSYAMLIGEDPHSVLITDAQRREVMREVLNTYQFGEADRVTLQELSLESKLTACLGLAASITDNQVTVEQVRTAMSSELERIEELTTTVAPLIKKPFRGTEASKSNLRSDLPKMETRLRERLALLGVVDAYFAYKKEHSMMEYADQVAFATRILQQVPAVGEEISKRYDMVLLDEYQDTSVNQAEFLRIAFSNTAYVCAVGDPNQAIYGWRGASANALVDFRDKFHVRDDAVLSLSTSFRNHANILRAANVITNGDRAKAKFDHIWDSFSDIESIDRYWARTPIVNSTAPALPVQELQPAPHSAHNPGEVVVAANVLSSDAYRAMVDRLADEMRSWTPEKSKKPYTAAVLVRKRSYTPLVTAELERVGLKFEVVDGEPLILVPEIKLVRALLALAVDEARGDAALTLLNYFNFGARDLALLSNLRVAGAHNTRSMQLGERVVHYSEIASALGADSSGRSSGSQNNLSSAAQERLEYLSTQIALLRASLDQPLLAVVNEACEILQLPQNVAARGRGAARVRLALVRFEELAQSFLQSHSGAGVTEFVQWLDEVEAHERVGFEDSLTDEALGEVPEELEARAGVVQVLTVHAAKGLGWNIVAVPELVGVGRVPKDWHFARNQIPDTLRADRDYVPQFVFAQDGDLAVTPEQSEEQRYRVWGLANCKYYDYNNRRRAKYYDGENRRVAYVAYTRARHLLILSTFAFRDLETLEKKLEQAGAKHDKLKPGQPLPPVPGQFQADQYLGELIEANAAAKELPFLTLCESNDLALGERGEFEFEFAELTALRDRLRERNAEHDDALISWPDSVDRSLIEPTAEFQSFDAVTGLEYLHNLEKQVAIVQSLQAETIDNSFDRSYFTASGLVSLMHRPDEYVLDQVRPMPSAPLRAGRRGTAVHEQIARYFTGVQQFDLDTAEDRDTSVVDDMATIEDQKLVETLYQRFAQSRFAKCKIVAVEKAVEIVLAGKPVRCVIDAVFDTSAIAGERTYTIVDWKTGRQPSQLDIAARQFQLALYRHAWAHSAGISVSDIGAKFYYLGESEQSNRELDAGELTLEELEEQVALRLTEGAALLREQRSM